MEEMGLTDVADFKVGRSAGAATLAYEHANQSRFGSPIFFKNNVDNRFASLYRVHRVMDLRSLERVFRRERPLNVEKIRSAASPLFIGVGNRKAGYVEYLDLTKRDDPISDLINSCRVPGATGVESLLSRYVDGNMGRPTQIDFAIDTLKATDLLVVSPGPLQEPKFPRPLRRVQPVVSEMIRRMDGLPNGPFLQNLIDLPSIRRGEFDRLDSVLDSSEVRVSLIYAKKLPFSCLSMERSALEAAYHTAWQFTKQVFEFA